MVDEYQDVNPLQKLLLEAWLGGRDDVCVVGDPRQTIYSFTGATPGVPDRLRGRVPGRPGHPAGPQLPVHAAGRGAGQPGLSRGRGGAPLAAQRPARRPRFAEYPDDTAEAGAVARQAAALVAAGTPAGEIAVLVRTNAQTAGFEQALADAGVPFQVRGAERFFDRPEVRQAVTLLRARRPVGGRGR